jgi:hypothetical protein
MKIRDFFPLPTGEPKLLSQDRPLLVGTKKAAALLGIRSQQIRCLARAGKLDGVFMIGGRYRFNTNQLTRMYANQKEPERVAVKAPASLSDLHFIAPYITESIKDLDDYAERSSKVTL